jgi:putative addiction module component (TIGR02574 family)
MQAVLPLDEMTVSEKLSTMETLWDDLCHRAEDIPSPAWHEDVLSKRQNLVKEGKTQFSDLEDVKKRVRKSTQ